MLWKAIAIGDQRCETAGSRLHRTIGRLAAIDTSSKLDTAPVASANRLNRGGDVWVPASAAGPELSRRCIKRSRSYQPYGGFGEAPSPSGLHRIYRRSVVRQPALAEAVVCESEFLLFIKLQEADAVPLQNGIHRRSNGQSEQ